MLHGSDPKLIVQLVCAKTTTLAEAVSLVETALRLAYSTGRCDQAVEYARRVDTIIPPPKPVDIPVDKLPVGQPD
jgi:hypothetical protein